MKTTKEIAELFCAELDRLAKGEVRVDVITGLEKCSNSLVKLARLEMDYAWKNWDGAKPAVPWVATSLIAGAPEPPSAGKRKALSQPAPTSESLPPETLAMVSALEGKRDEVFAQIADPKTSATLKRILQDKAQGLEDKIHFLKATAGKVHVEQA